MNLLGDLASSEALINDLYVELRKSVTSWSAITFQTPQARMGYIGQHLVSVVTGFPGGRSGARGQDLILGSGSFAEIKTCYRVDQLGSCRICSEGVSALEGSCASCGSADIERKDDSKWLIPVKTQTDFEDLVDPDFYYFVLFEFEDLEDLTNQNIVAKIWRVDTKALGFVACLVDYKLNIQPNSKSSAPFNLWPYSPKFYLMEPELIYESIISPTGVKTNVFPNAIGHTTVSRMPPISDLLAKRTLSTDSMLRAIELLGQTPVSDRKRPLIAEQLGKLRGSQGEKNFVEALTEGIYAPTLFGKGTLVPAKILKSVPALKKLLEA